jgi:hypothetical protein
MHPTSGLEFGAKHKKLKRVPRITIGKTPLPYLVRERKAKRVVKNRMKNEK